MDVLFGREARGRPSFRSQNGLPLLLILMVVLVVNLPALFGLVTTNPLVLNGFLAHVPQGHLPGLPYIDPNAGYTTQALGHLAALDWLHGHVPWWNPYEGVGSPLAGEMQSGAFFPPNLLLALPQGVLLVQVALEVTTGWSTYFLARRLGVGRSFSTTAGVAFGLCGTFAWFAHAPIRPIALLPLCLIGVERAIDAARAGRKGGWRLLAVALALSILAGFPETTLIDGVFVLWWSILRLAGPARASWRPAVAKLAAGGIVAVGLSAPLLVAFVDYLPYANTGGHQGAFSAVSLPTFGLAQAILPYSLGPIFGFTTGGGGSEIAGLWGSVGGYLSATVIAAGLVGLVGRRLRMLRLGLGAWIGLCLLRSFGFSPVVHAMAVVPGIRLTAFYRYADPSWELAAILLAALGLDDIARHATRRRVLVVGGAVTALLAAWAAITAWRLLPPAISMPSAWGTRARLYPLASLGCAVAALLVLCIGGFIATRRRGATGHVHGPPMARAERTQRRGRLLMAGALCTESVLLVGVTYLSAPRPTALEAGSVRWLQANLGTSRFTTLGPIQPEYGSYFGIAEVNTIDLPSPSAWVDYISTRLDPNTSPLNFSGGIRIDPAGPTPAEALSTNLSAFEAIGVRYVVEKADGADLFGRTFPAPGSPLWPAGPRLVYRDDFAEIWQLPSASPVFGLVVPTQSGTGSGAIATGQSQCAVHWSGWDQATVHCPYPSVLIRLDQFMPGWRATVNGKSESVEVDDFGPKGLFQKISLPAGTTTVDFTFLPPHEVLAVGAAVLALVVVAGSLGLEWIRRRRTRPDGEAPTIDYAPAPSSQEVHLG